MKNDLIRQNDLLVETAKFVSPPAIVTKLIGF